MAVSSAAANKKGRAAARTSGIVTWPSSSTIRLAIGCLIEVGNPAKGLLAPPGLGLVVVALGCVELADGVRPVVAGGGVAVPGGGGVAVDGGGVGVVGGAAGGWVGGGGGAAGGVKWYVPGDVDDRMLLPSPELLVTAEPSAKITAADPLETRALNVTVANSKSPEAEPPGSTKRASRILPVLIDSSAF
jgi:hypothetical protein